MPRPAPRVAPATRATRPVSGLREDLFFAMVVSVCGELNDCLVYVKSENEEDGRRFLNGRLRKRHCPVTGRPELNATIVGCYDATRAGSNVEDHMSRARDRAHVVIPFNA